MQKFRFLLMAVFCAALFPLAVSAHEFKAGDLLIGHPWARATAGQMGTGAVYFSVTNNGREADKLIAAATPVAAEAQLHVHLMEDGVMKMRPVENIDIVPGTPVVLKPSGLHVMLMGLHAPLKEGDSFPLTLSFQKAGAVTVSVLVEGVAATHSDTENHMNHEDHMAH
jgi:hypothetical protein